MPSVLCRLQTRDHFWSDRKVHDAPNHIADGILVLQLLTSMHTHVVGREQEEEEEDGEGEAAQGTDDKGGHMSDKNDNDNDINIDIDNGRGRIDRTAASAAELWRMDVPRYAKPLLELAARQLLALPRPVNWDHTAAVIKFLLPAN